MCESLSLCANELSVLYCPTLRIALHALQNAMLIHAWMLSMLFQIRCPVVSVMAVKLHYMTGLPARQPKMLLYP